MDRLEVQRRLFNAIQILMRRGWSQRQVNNMLNGLHCDDAVEVAERHADQNHTVHS